MNNYLKGFASLLGIFYPQTMVSDTYKFELDDYQALISDWERISKDLETSLITQFANMDDISRDRLIASMKDNIERLKDISKKLEINLEMMKHIKDNPELKKWIEASKLKDYDRQTEKEKVE